MHNLVPLVLNALKTIEEGKSIRVTLRSIVDDSQLTKEDESLLYYYIFEIYRKLNLIDLYIKTSSDSFSLKKLRVENRSLLRLATHLLKIDGKPIKEVYGYLADYYSHINKMDLVFILQSIENVKEVQLYENRDDLASKLSLQYFLPTWVIRKFIKQWGVDFTLDLLPSFLETPPLYVRINTLKAKKDEVLESLKNQNVEFEEVKQIENLLKILKTPIPIPRTAEYVEGKIVIQQKASAAVSLIINPRKKESILDMCASPGGKTSHIAALIENSQGILAVDLNDERTRILKKRLNLLCVKNVEIIQADARTLYKKYGCIFDKILVDPPCSGSGTYSSRPENRWKLRQRDLRWYVNLQKDLLQEAGKLVKPDGYIVYSTCSLFNDENSDIVSSFLKTNGNFHLETTIPTVGVQTKIENGEVQEVFPHLHETEGFFIAKLKRKG